MLVLIVRLKTGYKVTYFNIFFEYMLLPEL